MANPTVKDLVIAQLKEGGFDGLMNDEGCGCLCEDLMPCGEPSPECEAGYKVSCDGTCEDGKCDFHLSEVKESGDAAPLQP